MNEAADAGAVERRGISRRDAIKRAAIVGGVVAWAAPTVQILGQSAAFAQSIGTLPEPCPCTETENGVCTKRSKPPAIAVMQFSLSASCVGPACTPVDAKSCYEAGNAVCTGTVKLTPFDSKGGATGTLSTTTLTPPASFTWTGPWGGNEIILLVSPTSEPSPDPEDPDTYCQKYTLHISCSDAGLAPVVTIGCLTLTAWGGTTGDDDKKK